MLYASCVAETGSISDRDAAETMSIGFARADAETAAFTGKRVLALIPDNTRTCPLPMLFRETVAQLASKVAQLDFLIALGTHQPMSDAAINTMLGLTPSDREGRYRNVRIFNHRWDLPDTFTSLGTIPSEKIRQITTGLMACDVPIGINKLILDYDQILIIGPTYPHEVVGFSGGLKYFFPGICTFEFIDFFHWLGAMITCFSIIGTKKTPVRDVIDEAATLLPRPVLNLNVVVHDGELTGLFLGEPREAWSHAADLSERLHIVTKDKPFHTVLGICPPMYDELWTGGKVMYKLEPIVADGGELIIYAPHISEISFTHGASIERVGYHVRDYFASRMEEFAEIPRGVLAHSTHVRGLGTFLGGVEKPRITVTLASNIPQTLTEKVNLSWRDWRSIDVESMRGREGEGILVVDHAGEVLHKLFHKDAK